MLPTPCHPARRTVARLAACALLAAALFPAACATNPHDGYSFDSSFRSGVSSVNVPVFRNDTFARGVEVELAEAIAHEIRTRTPWRVVQNSTASTALAGTITSADLSRISTARDTGLVEELAYSLTIDFSWTDSRTGKSLLARRNFRAAEPFVPAKGTDGPINERLEVGQAGAVQELARRIVDEMRSGW